MTEDDFKEFDFNTPVTTDVETLPPLHVNGKRQRQREAVARADAKRTDKGHQSKGKRLTKEMVELSVREKFLAVNNRLQEDDWANMEAWARRNDFNLTVFYRIMSKMIPTEVNSLGSGPVIIQLPDL